MGIVVAPSIHMVESRPAAAQPLLKFDSCKYQAATLSSLNLSIRVPFLSALLLRRRMTLLPPPQLRLLRLPLIKLALRALNHRLLSRRLPSLGQIAILQILLKLGDIRAEAIIRNRKRAWPWDICVAVLDGSEERSVRGLGGKHGEESGLLGRTQARPSAGLEEHVVDVGFDEAAGGVRSDVDWVEDFTGGLLGWERLEGLGFLEVFEAFWSLASARWTSVWGTRWRCRFLCRRLPWGGFRAGFLGRWLCFRFRFAPG